MAPRLRLEVAAAVLGQLILACAAQESGASGEAASSISSQFSFPEGAIPALGVERLQIIIQNSAFGGTPQELAALLEQQADLGVDKLSNRLVYRCQALAANASREERAAAAEAAAELLAAAAAAEAAAAAAQPPQLNLTAPDPVLSAAAVFNLSSRPDSPRKIFLDFDGHVTSNTDWNAQAGRPVIVTPPFDKDGSPGTFSAAELADIVAIWRAVAEDYSIFDVDVTTRDPGTAAMANGLGMRCAIGGSAADWLGSTAGGVAYVNSFGNLSASPCFVFPKELGPDLPKYIWEAVSHELGHTLGLRHDGVLGGVPYFKGQGDWASIMGVSYYEPITQWDKGEYRNSNNMQEDVQVIQVHLPLLPPPGAGGAGGPRADAVPLNASAPDPATGLATASASGVIASANERHVYWFDAAAPGTAAISARGLAPWGKLARGNLDLEVALFDDLGRAVLHPVNPAGGAPGAEGPLAASVRVALPASGRYYLHVAGAGQGDPKAGGYSSYGSLGQYSLTVSFPAAAAVVVVQPAPPPLGSAGGARGGAEGAAAAGGGGGSGAEPAAP